MAKPFRLAPRKLIQGMKNEKKRAAALRLTRLRSNLADESGGLVATACVGDCEVSGRASEADVDTIVIFFGLIL